MDQQKSFISYSTAAFFLSGCSALIFETVWFRAASVALGTTVWSAAVVLMAFMTGLGLGNAVVAFQGHKIHSPVRFYVLIEILIGISGLAAVFLLPGVSGFAASMLAGLTENGLLLNAARFFIAFLVLLVPATAMGATLPVLHKALHRVEQSFSSSIARLYGWNTLGAVVGTLAAEFFLIYWLGLNAVGVVACLLNLLAALLLFNLFGGEFPSFDSNGNELGKKSLPQASWLLIPPAVIGMSLLALEIIWFRYLLLTQNESSTLFATMLAIVLVGIAMGGLLVSRIRTFADRLSASLAIIPVVAAASTVAGLVAFQFLYSNYLPQLRESFGFFTLAAMVLMLPTSIASGILFPLYGERFYQHYGVDTQASGMLTVSNTLGAALGSSLATLVLLPLLGIERSLLLIVTLYLLVALLSMTPAITTGLVTKFKATTVIASILVLALFPFGSLQRSYQVFDSFLPDMELVAVNESLYSTLQYYEIRRLGQIESYRLVTNGYSMSGTDFSGERYMKLFAYLPAILHGNLQDILLISYGVGNTAEAATNLSTLQSLDIVDVSEEIVEMSRPFHQVIGYDPLDDPRTEVHIDDGRFFLQTTDRKYDLITGEPPPPKAPMIVNLYSKEFFELTYEHLNPGGMISYWLPIHDLHDSDSIAIIKAFCEVYRDCSLWNGYNMDWILLGSRDGLPAMDEQVLQENWARYANQELSDIGIETRGLLGATFMADAAELNRLSQRFLPVTDNYPQRISPSTQGMLDPSPLYAHLLNIDTRKQRFRESDYINFLLPNSFRQEVNQAFEYERIASLVALNPHMDYTLPYYWDGLSQLMEDSQLRVLPLLLLGSNPREQSIRAGMRDGTDLNTRAALIKHLLVERDYAALELEAERYLRIETDQNTRLFISQIQMLAKALQGTLSDSDVQNSLAASDARFVDWIKAKY
ncbi:MAG: hypothetical protein RL839_01120 [Gammaproteobacteria bacterium]